MDTITTQMPAVATETCASCGAQLADDQRYCLNCGARRGDARVPFMEILGGRPTTPVAGSQGGAAGDPARSQRNLTIVASIGCLLLALGVGVLIGHGGRDKGASPAAPAQVIKVQGGGAAATDAGATGGGAAATNKASKSKKGAAATAGSSHATNKAIKNLDKLSPEQYQKQSQKLPKTVGTGGKAPPKDKKPAAGGGKFQDFG